MNGLSRAHCEDTAAVTNDLVHAHFDVTSGYRQASLTLDMQLFGENSLKIVKLVK